MLSISLFGPTTVTSETGQAITDLGGVKPRQVLEILGVCAGSPVPKDRLAERLWAGGPPKSYVGTLESHVCVLRRALGIGRGRNSVVATTPNGYVLDVSQVRVDLAEARHLLRAAASAEPRASVRLVGEAVDHARAELLASDAYASWAIHERGLFRAELAEACNRASVLAFALGDYGPAIRFARQATVVDMYAEDAWQNLMRGLWLSGRRCEALRAFLDMRALFVEELGVDPGPVSRALYLEILRDEGAGRERDAADTQAEIATLVALLRQAMEAVSGADLAPGDVVPEVVSAS